MNIVVLAGIPRQIEGEFSRSREKVFPKDRYELVWSPANSAQYTSEYVDSLYKKLWDKIHLLWSEKSKYDALNISLFLFFIDYKDPTAEKLKLAFSPEALPISVLPTVEFGSRLSPNKIRNATNRLLSALRQTLRSAERALPAVKKEITSNDNKTPILLPAHNFGYGEVIDFLWDVGNKVLEGDPFEAIKQSRIRFEGKHPKVKVGKGSRSHFQSQTGVVFQSPGKLRHGAARIQASAGHPHACFIRSRLRLGAAFDSRFHYDCVKPTGRFPDVWKSCHRQDFQTPDGRDHVNIAPNDHVR